MLQHSIINTQSSVRSLSRLPQLLRHKRLSFPSGNNALPHLLNIRMSAVVCESQKKDVSASLTRESRFSERREGTLQVVAQRALGALFKACFSAAVCVALVAPMAYAEAPLEPQVKTSPVFSMPGLELPQAKQDVSEGDSQAIKDADLTPEEKATVALFERNTPSVVNIANLAAYSRNPYSMDVTMIPQGTGSGFIWDDKGHVVTNYHVVKGSSALKVTLYDSTSCSAKIVGMDENKDIAVLKLDIPDAQAKNLRKGLVSGLQREIQANSYGPKIKGVIQTDAAINPGNSGGILLNSSGNLIGVNSAILDPSQRGSFSGVGQVIRPVLGITMGPPALISRLNIDGVLVYSAPLGGPAGDAGVQGCQRSQFGDLVVGDIIVGVDGKKIRNYADLFEALDEYKPGDKINVEVFRTSKRKQFVIPVVLGQRSPDMQDG